jgi:ceramide glucosyltransferase
LIVNALWWASCALTLASIAYLLLAIVAVASHRQRPGPGWAIPPQVTILKPLCGRETGLEAALESFFAQETDSSVRFVFGASDPADPALRICSDLAARFPACRVEFVIDSSERGRNPKVSNLINMARAGLDEIVVISDSDILIAPGTLQAAIDALAAEGVGAVTTLYRARPSLANDRVRSFGAWYLDYWDLPMQMLYARLAPLATAYGPLTAVRRDALEAFGGLPALADHLCDDAELGRLVREAGYRVTFTPALAETLVNDATLPQLFQHELRWARTTRGLTPGGFAASVVNCPGLIPLLLLLHPGVPAVLAIAAPILLRWLLACTVVRRFGRAPEMVTPGPVDLWLRDCACFVVWAAAFLVSHVNWRGQRLSLRHGLIQPNPVPIEQNA